MYQTSVNMTHDIKLKRTYEQAEPSDGFRVLVDRLWPQGLSHENFHYDLWEKEIAPSTELREWFHANPSEQRWAEFEKRYEAELKANPAFPEFVEMIEDKPVVTLLYSSKNTEMNNAVIVRNVLLSELK